MQVHRGEYIGYMEIVHNGGNYPHAVEIVVNERILDVNGNIEKTSVPSKDFLIYPSQIVLYPGEQVKAQVLYRSGKVEADKAYIVHTKEVPLPKGHKDAPVAMGLNVMVGYDTNILMDTGKPGSLSFVSSQKLDSGKVEVIMENKSNGRFKFDNAYLFAGKEKITDFTGKANSVMPGQKRRFVFKYNRPLSADEVRFGK